MKITGLSSLRRVGTYTMRGAGGEAVTLTIAALPIGFAMDIVRELPGPGVPQRQVGINAKTGPVMTPDPEDPDYRAASAENDRLQLAMVVATALRSEPAVKFDAQRTAFPKAVDYWRAVLAELIDFGFTDADLVGLKAAVVRLSLDQEKIDEAKQVFPTADR